MTVDRARFPHEADDCFYSDLKVLESNAGFYIGRTCWDKEGGFEEPFSRESAYFTKRDEAEKALHEGFEVRGGPGGPGCVENELAYETGYLPKPHQPEDN